MTSQDVLTSADVSFKAQLMTAGKDVFSGLLGGVAQVAAGHPLDTIKVRLQTQVIVPGEKPAFDGMVDCAKKTLAAEGVKGLYKGCASPLAGAMIINAVLFSSYGQAQQLLAKGKKTEEISLATLSLAGSMAGFTAALIEAPFDLLKIKMQAQVGEGQYRGVVDCARQIVARHGITAMTQGLGATIARNTPAYAAYFYTYEGTRRLMTKPGEQPNLMAACAGGGVSGFAFWGVLYPVEVIKTKLQTDSIIKSERKYKGWFDCWNKTVQEQGYKGLFRGYVPAVVRAVPVNAVVFAAVVTAKQALE